MKKFIPTVLAIAVFVALFVWVKVSGMDGEVDEEEETPEEEAVWKVDAQDIEAIRVEREDGMLVFNKEKGGGRRRSRSRFRWTERPSMPWRPPWRLSRGNASNSRIRPWLTLALKTRRLPLRCA
ncbi:hypothetical protein [Novibacillus thermophilus]|uniref:hypothetical protein n=1 Tax=Novibacillus thermophilus TaxID=1471761 RepID=UPI001E5DC230|nr:hypothetical protein [Novibacillus thermophilus]